MVDLTADSTDVRYSMCDQSAWDELPETPVMQTLPFMSESITKNVDTISEKNLRADRQTAYIKQVGTTVTGEMGFSFVPGANNNILQKLLMTPVWSADIGIVDASDIAATGTGFTSTSTDFVAQGIVVGIWMRVRGFLTEGIDDYYRITSVTANELVTSPAPPDTEVAGEDITIDGRYIRNGVDIQYMILEKSIDKLTQHLLYDSLVPDTFSLDFKTKDSIDGSFTFMGREGVISDTEFGGSYLPQSTEQAFDSVYSIGSLRLDGLAITDGNFINSMSLNYANKTRFREAIAVKSADGSPVSTIGVGRDKIAITGTLNTYFATADLLNAYYNGTHKSLDYRLSNDNDGTLIFDMPKIAFTTGAMNVAGEGQDLRADLGYEAVIDPITGRMITICAFEPI